MTARVKDLWISRRTRQKTSRHPDNGGNKNAKRWLAVWAGPDGEEKCKAFRKQSDALAYAKKMESDLERGEYIDPGAGRALIGPLGAKWLRLRDVGASSRARYESAYRMHIEPTFGHRRVGSVKPSEVLEWSRALARTHGISTQQATHTILCGVFDLAVADGLRRDNPARSPIVPRPRREPKERQTWDADQIWAVTGACPQPYRVLAELAAGCGMRDGEAFGAAIEDFDFEGGKVRIRRQIARAGRVIVAKLPKGGKERSVPLPRGVAAAVHAHIAVYPVRSCTLPWLQEDGEMAGDPCTFGLLCRWMGDHPKTHGQPIRASSFDNGAWKPALAAAGVIPPYQREKKYPKAREDGMHALRHWYTTCLLDAGVSLAGVMAFLGHSRKGQPVTLGVYGHVTEQTYESARNAVDRALYRLRPVPGLSPAGTAAERRAAR